MGGLRPPVTEGRITAVTRAAGREIVLISQFVIRLSGTARQPTARKARAAGANVAREISMRTKRDVFYQLG